MKDNRQAFSRQKWLGGRRSCPCLGWVVLVLVLAASLLAPCQDGFAQLGFSDPVPMNNAATDSGLDENPRITTDGLGHWVAVWQSQDSLGGTIGTDQDILVSRSSDNGATWTPPQPLNTNAATDDSVADVNPYIATDGLGHWMAVWSGPSSGIIGTDGDILMSHSSDNGATWTPPQPLNTNAATDSGGDGSAQVTTDGLGHWVAVWESRDSLDGTIGIDTDILVSRSSDNGVTWTPPQPLNTNAASDSGWDWNPKVTTDGLGHWVAVWQSPDSLDDTIGTDNDILMSRSSDNGATWTPPQPLNTNAASDSRSDGVSHVTTDGKGHWVAVWQSWDTLGGTIGTDTDILVSRSSNNGVTWSPPQALNTNAANDSSEDWGPQVTTDGLGHWVAVWGSGDTLGETVGTDSDILVSRSIDNGVTWSPPQPLNTNAATDSGGDWDPQVATDGLGHWVTVWESGDTLGGTIDTDNDILVAYELPSLVFSDPVPLNTNAASDSGSDWYPQVTTDGLGHWVAVWQSSDTLGGAIGGDNDILVSRSTDYGATWTPPQALNTNAAIDSGSDLYPQVATDDGGNWVAVWQSEGTIGTDWDILVGRSSDYGATWTPPQALNTNAASDSGYDWHPQVTTDGLGHWVAVWYSGDTLNGTIGGDSDILVSRSSDYGATWTPPEALNTNATSDSGGDSEPQIMADGLGHWVAVWSSVDSLGGTIGTDNDILVSRSSDYGATWTAPQALNTNAASDSGADSDPQVTTDDKGNWVAVWESSDTLGGTIGTDWDILVSRSSNNGVTWTHPQALNTNAASDSGDDGNPQMATDGLGHWVAVWYSGDTLSGTIGTDSDILVSRSSDNGVSWTPSQSLNTNAASDSGGDLDPQVMTDGLGHWGAVWQSVDGTIGIDWDILVAYEVPPVVSSIVRIDPNPTLASSVHFAVSFSEDVTGVDTRDFTVEATDISNANVEAVSGSGNIYTVTVNTGTGNGTIRLHVTDDDTIRDVLLGTRLGGLGAGTGDFTASEVYVIDKTPPEPGTVASNAGPYTIDNTQLVFSWSGFSDPETNIAYYEVAFGNQSDPEAYQTFAAVGLNTTVTFLAEDFSEAFPGGVFAEGPYLCTVRAVNNADVRSAPVASTIIVDISGPQKGEVTSNTGPYTIDNTQLIFSWFQTPFSDPQSDIASYEVAFGNQSNPEAYQTFVAVGLNTTVTFLVEDFPEAFPEGIFAEGGTYVCTVRAINGVGLQSAEATYAITVDTRAFKVGEAIPLPDGKTWDDIDWDNTTFDPPAFVIKINPTQQVLTGDWGENFSIDWHFKDGGGFIRYYTTSSEPAQDPMVIYYTDDLGAPTNAPPVDLSSIPNVTIHYNDTVHQGDSEQAGDEILWLQGGKLYARGPIGQSPALVLLQYNDGDGNLIGIETVQVKSHATPDVEDGLVDIGSRLRPHQSVPNAVALVTRGGTGSTPQYIYQHAVADAPQQGQVWAIRQNDDSFNMEVIWMRTGLGGITWPYELRRYRAQWPGDPSKYQLYIRSNVLDALGPDVIIPEALNAELQDEEFDTPTHHAHLDGNRFYADGPGWALLKYQTGPTPGVDWVGFEVVRCVLHTDTSFFDLTPVAWNIGTEITDPYHQTSGPGTSHGNQPGYIHVPEGDRYAPAIYDTESGGTGQIFAVNKGLLEVWWSNLSRTQDPDGPEYPPWPSDPSQRVQWPSKVVRYEAKWPDEEPIDPEHIKEMGKIIIARQNGTGVIDEAAHGSDWAIYVQNEPGQPGFNPNDEHAMKAPYASGSAIFAIRDDLGTAQTSEPYVLMQYKVQPEAPDKIQWRFRVWKVVREEAPYVFSNWAHLSTTPDPQHDPQVDPYEGEAGKLIQAPLPLSLLQYCQETEAVSGPAFEDRTQRHWARSASNDGGSADITMRYYYPVQEDFFFPDGFHPVGEHVPWLPDQNGTPVDVTYTVSWPDDVPIMKLGQTIIEAMFGLPTISGQESVDIIYQQSVALGGGPSVILIDPVQTRQVDLARVPDDILTESQGAERIFPDLSLALRLRISYDPLTQKLKFKGLRVDPVTGFAYALLNVMSTRDRDELLALSQNPVWQSAVLGLYQATQVPVAITGSSLVFDELALTSGFAEGTGYVTLVMQDAAGLEPLPVSLEIIKVVPELDPGDILVITAQCPFDETLTLRHRGDFGGRTDYYEFQWRYFPDEGGTPPLLPDANDNWLTFTAQPSGEGAVDITIKGPGLLTLSDNWFTCRYRYTGQDRPWSGIWSDWTPAQLAQGWIKRVVGDINPFTQRASGGGIEGAENSFFSYKDQEVNTVVSMISQAGPRWTGNVPLNCQNLDDFGLLQIYETVLGRGIDLSIDGLPPVNYPPANTALLLVASRIADLYVLLGNEAYADAADPTIAFGTDDGQYGAEAASIHCFANVTSSLLEEELALLRGRDDTRQPSVTVHPIYNRLIWNFTNDFTGGEVAYALNYNIQDENGDAAGTINEADAKALYPQGHGDAWGHYLTAIKTYYKLLAHPNYTWNARAEGVLVGGQPVTVDYLDERKFAKAAAAKARTGAEIVNLTYRSAYVEDPAGQWQGYKDTNPARTWGLSEWASRAALGTYIDWVVGNAILPPEDIAHTGIQKIDRTTVLELREVASRFEEIQAQVDTADLGLNPLGLATNVVPFDISPEGITNDQTHFEQIYNRAVTALNNAITVFNHANNSTQLLRRQADRHTDFEQTVEEREADFTNRLIQIFGYPYADDIGAGRTYPTGYSGPDLYHYMYVDPSELMGIDPPPVYTFPVEVTDFFDVDLSGGVVENTKEITFHFSTEGLGFIKPPAWQERRRAPGEIQMARSDLMQAKARFERALVEYHNLLEQIEDEADLLHAQYNLNREQINILYGTQGEQEALNQAIFEARQRQMLFRTIAQKATIAANAVAEGSPGVFGVIAGMAGGVIGDWTSPVRAAIRLAGSVVSEIMNRKADSESLRELAAQQAKEMVQSQSNIDMTTLQADFAIQQRLKQVTQLIRNEASLRLELYAMQEALQQAAGRYQTVLAHGLRLLEDRTRFRRQTAAQVQSYRYKDMAFRIFRNDALQKYRAQFDLAARYVYLAAKAYDFETTLLSSDTRAGQAFLTDIVRARLIGTIQGGLPQTGVGLASAMAQMSQNFGILKGQLGFNNPQKETNRFSLRSELFRIQPSFAGNAVWREILRRHVVPNLLDIPEFQRYARVFEPHKALEPGIVIPFETNVNFGLNFFGWPLGGGDSAYDSTNFTTKVRSVGVWFTNYNNLVGGGMSETPRVYLIPAGTDIQRSPTYESGEIREFNILDQRLPVPFAIGEGILANNPGWIPENDTQVGTFADIRRYSSFRAYHDSGQFTIGEVHRDSRLIGRSIWNTRWLLIIPAGTLHTDRDEGLNRFIDGQLLGGERDSNGVSDIKIFFETYAYSGN